MPASSDLIAYGAASRPEDDASTTGGAIDKTSRPLDSQLAANAAIAVVSDDAADTMNLTVTGRLPSGEIDTEVIALTGTSEAVGGTTFERILKLELATAAAGSVTVRQGSAGATRHVFAAGETDAFILFIGVVADPDAEEEWYEKVFWENEHATESLTDAEVTLTADPDALFEIGVAGAVDDSETVANRLAAPSGETFVDNDVAQAVPGDILAAGEGIGVWVRMTLGAAEAAGKSTFTIQLAGSSV